MWRRCGISSLAALSLALAHHTETRPSDLGPSWWGILVMAPVPFLLVGGCGLVPLAPALEAQEALSPKATSSP